MALSSEPLRGGASYLGGIATGSLLDVGMSYVVMKVNSWESTISSTSLPGLLISGSVEAMVGVFVLDMLVKRGLNVQNTMLFSVGFFPQLKSVSNAGYALSASLLGLL